MGLQAGLAVMGADRMLIPVHESDLVLYAVATPVAMREAMVRAFEYAKGRCVPPDEVELIDEETGEIRTRQLRIVIGPDVDPMTVKQRGFLHAAVFPQIAEQAVVNGERFKADVWKEWYRQQFLGHRWESVKLPGQKRATPRKVRISTEDLSVKQYSDHIDRVIAHAATDLGVVFEFRPSEREAVRWKRKPRKQATPTPALEHEAVPA